MTLNRPQVAPGKSSHPNDTSSLKDGDDNSISGQSLSINSAPGKNRSYKSMKK